MRTAETLASLAAACRPVIAAFQQNQAQLRPSHYLDL